MPVDFANGLFFRQSTKFVLALSCVFSLTSCDLAKNYTRPDRAADIEIQDFRDGLAERLPEVHEDDSKSSLASVPELQPYVTMTSQSIEAMPLVSVSVNQSVPIKDILYELAQQAEYDIELDPNIRGSIIFTARQKPFDVVVKRISEIAGLRYKFEDSFLRVEVDTPYNKTYKIDYLSFIRSNQGTVSSSVSVVSGEGADTGSSYSAASDSVSDFWGELEANLGQILGGASRTLKTNRDPRISAVEQNPQVAAVSPQQGQDGVQVQPPEAVLRVESLPVDDMDDAMSSSSSSTDGNRNGFTFSLNKQAGMINVYANQYAQKEVEQYLTSLRKSVTSQVLVEAKVFEVSLFDEYVNGIEWQAITNDNSGIVRFLEGTDSLIGNITTPGGDIATVANFGVGYVGGEVGAFIEAISGFGTVRALASPRLTVLNNQSAVLNVATNRVFFEIDLDRETDDDTGDVTLEVDTEIKSVPEGVLINVQPSIDLENKTISMFIRPTVTRIVGTVQDPSVQFAAGDSGIVSEIPEVNIQEIDTVVKVNSGQPIVMGGLLQDRAVANHESVPVAGEVPVFGALFRKQQDLVSKTELVVFLKATLVENGNDTIHDTDRDLYRAFSADRRPLKM